MSKRDQGIRNGSESSGNDTVKGGFGGYSKPSILMGKKDRFETEPQFSTSIFLPSSPEAPTEQKMSRGFGENRKAMALLGRDDSNNPSQPVSSQSRDNNSIAPWDVPSKNPNSNSTSNTTSIAPWDTQPHSNSSISPWDSELAPPTGSKAQNQNFFNESNENVGQLSPSFRASGSPDLGYDGDHRRPSVASANTVSSQGSNTSKSGRFHKSLKGFFGDDYAQSDSKKTSETSLPPQSQNGKDYKKEKVRNDSAATQKALNLEDPSRPHTPLASSDVTPWAYQNFSDVSNYGDAPVRNSPLEDSLKKGGAAPASAPKEHRGLLHRHTKSKEDPPKSQPSVPASNPSRLTTSRDSSQIAFSKGVAQNSTPMSSVSALGVQGSNPVPGGRGQEDKKAPPAQPEKKGGLFSKLKRHKDKDKTVMYQDLSKISTTPPKFPDPPTKSKGPPPTPSPSKKEREASVATFDSGSTIRPTETFEKIDRTFTASSKMSSKFGRHGKRGVSYESQGSDRTRQGSQATSQQSDLFTLDTNLDDMSDIIAKSPTDPNVLPSIPSKDLKTPGEELGAPVWDAPDSWAVKGQGDDVLEQVPEDDEGGLPAIEEDDGTVYFMRVFRTDSTFATLSTGVNATVSDVLQMLAKKSVLHDSIDNYQLLIRKHELTRQLQAGERPIAIQKKLLESAGYEANDHIEEIGREDNSYLCRFTFTHEKMTGYGQGLEKDPAFTKMQKFSHVDLQGKSLVTIPITLYTKASEIISLNLSRNLALNVPKDFIQACINLREIKFTANEIWRLPASLSYASRLTVLDISNNRIDQLQHAELDRLHGLVSIKIANNKLSDFPPYFSKFRQLRSLNMSSNNFATFPDSIANLKSLVDLDISFNKLSSLQGIGNLLALERLWVTNNDLKGPFDASLKRLINLKEIDARFNGITNIDNVAGLPKLEQLLVGHNNISSFTGSFAKLRTLVLDHCPVISFDLEEPVPSLTSLNMASAKLVAFKDTMFDNMPNLQKLNLDKNHFINMSLQIGRLTKLEHFSMAKNPLNLIPPSIGNLVELKFLNLRECNLKSLPSEIWYCLKLETLNVSSNVLESFPKQIAVPPQATKDVNGTPATTPGLSTSPSFEELGKLEDFGARRPSQASGLISVGHSPVGSQRKGSIVSLYGQGNRKTSVVSRTNTEGTMTPVTRKDSNISQARFTNTFAGSMRYLYLADNRLEDEVFRELYMLPELRLLNLSYNELTDLPQGLLRRWTNLAELYISGNQITSLPSDDLEEGSNLKILHINANRFQVLPAELTKIHKLAILDVGSNSLKYNVSNWPYDWNWNWNHNLKVLNFSGNKRLEIRPATQHQLQYNSMNGSGNKTDLTSFASLNYLRVLGLMDVTLTVTTIPDESEDRRVRTSASLSGAVMYGMADTLGRHEHLSILDIFVGPFRGHEEEVLVGMFDGQSLSSGGSKVAKYLHENFASTFADELAKLRPDDIGPVDALRRTFLTLNKDMANLAGQTIDAREQRGSLSSHRGSVAQVLTADDLNSGGVATILYLNNTDLFVANVGDAQALLISANAQYKFLTEKHDPAATKERERIRAAGGYVSRQGKLNDELEVSRAFGYFKHMPSVIAAPHTTQESLTDSDELILVASKEFWDFVTPDLAVDVARAEKADLMLSSQKLRDLAMAYGATSKIMVMVLGISDLRKRNSSRYRGSTLSMAQSYGQDDAQLFPSKTRRRKGEGVGDSRLARLEEPEAPVGDVAIVFTDIKNSTALWELLPMAMRSSIQIHNELFRRQLRLIGGYEVKTEGDAFMVSFPTVTSALLWCFSCQSHLLELAWPAEILDTVHCAERFDSDQNRIYRGLSVRMGIHWGHPVCESDPITRRMDYFGPMVNRAARISSVADGGQISVSSDFIAEIQRTLEAYADTGRSNSVGSDDTVNDDPMGNVIRRELGQLSSQGFEVKELGEKKLKGLENPEFVYLMYPHSLAGRLAVASGGDKPGANEIKDDPGALGKDSKLDIKTDAVWQLWDLALRLEMLCSCLENPDKAKGLKKPELSLLNRMKNNGGEITDEFMMNLLEHQVTRIETCANTLQIRHMLKPLKAGDKLGDHARPIGEVMSELAEALKELRDFKAEKKSLEEGGASAEER